MIVAMSALVLALVLAFATSVAAEGVWVLSFPDRATCEAFKDKGQAPGFAEWKAQRETGKAPVRPAYRCEQWEHETDGRLKRVPDTIDPRGWKRGG